jgi:hypothetical protein
MSDRPDFRWATTGARLLTGTLVAAGFSIAVVTAVSIPWPTVVREPVRIVATPDPSASVVACSGPLLALARNAEDAAELTVAAPQNVTPGVREGDPEPEESTLETVVADPAPQTFVAQPVDGRRVDVAASGSSIVAADDLAGFAASACRPPLMESWLASGSTVTGTADLVLLANPGDVVATVDLTVFGAGEPEIPPGGSKLVLAPRTQLVVPLSGLARGEDNPVIRVSASGAPVAASLQSSTTRTLLPGGVELTGAIAAPEPSPVIPGVRVTTGPPVTSDGDDTAPGSNRITSLVRLLAPNGPATATVTVTATASSTPAIDPVTVTLPAGSPVEVELDGLAVGDYTVHVDAEAPVIAAAWQTTGFGAGSDFAWYLPAPEIAAASLFTTPAGPAPTLSIANTGDAERTVTVTAVGGSPFGVDVAPGATATVRLAARSVYDIDPGGTGVHATIALSGDGALASYPVWPSDAAAPPIVVYP